MKFYKEYDADGTLRCIRAFEDHEEPWASLTDEATKEEWYQDLARTQGELSDDYFKRWHDDSVSMEEYLPYWVQSMRIMSPPPAIPGLDHACNTFDGVFGTLAYHTGYKTIHDLSDRHGAKVIISMSDDFPPEAGSLKAWQAMATAWKNEVIRIKACMSGYEHADQYIRDTEREWTREQWLEDYAMALENAWHSQLAVDYLEKRDQRERLTKCVKDASYHLKMAAEASDTAKKILGKE